MNFKIGQHIKYIGHSGVDKEPALDIGKRGIIVDVAPVYRDLFIHLPNSSHISMYSPRRGKTVSWQVGFDSVKLLNDTEENGQMLFEFMYDE